MYLEPCRLRVRPAKEETEMGPRRQRGRPPPRSLDRASHPREFPAEERAASRCPRGSLAGETADPTVSNCREAARAKRTSPLELVGAWGDRTRSGSQEAVWERGSSEVVASVAERQDVVRSVLRLQCQHRRDTSKGRQCSASDLRTLGHPSLDRDSSKRPECV